MPARQSISSILKPGTARAVGLGLVGILLWAGGAASLWAADAKTWKDPTQKFEFGADEYSDENTVTESAQEVGAAEGADSGYDDMGPVSEWPNDEDPRQEK